MAIEAVLCDIGNVAVFFDNRKSDRAFAALSGKTEDEVRRIVFRKGSALINRYERGDISTEEFRRVVCSRLNITKRELPSDEAFDEAWSDVFTVNESLLLHLVCLSMDGAVLAAVSNIDPLRHRQLERLEQFGIFDHLLMSYVERMRKPSEELMVRALDRCGVTAERSIFIDDIAENLVPAAKLGIVTHQYTDIPSLISFLRENVD